MAALLITWDDKVTLNASTEADINVVRDSDMNQVKSRINNHAALIDTNTAKVSFPEAPEDGTPYSRQDAGWVAAGATWVPSLVTGDVTAVQNTVTSDISAQTGTKTFTGIDWNITVGARSSTGVAPFLHFEKDSNQVFDVSIDGITTIQSGDPGGSSSSFAQLHLISSSTIQGLAFKGPNTGRQIIQFGDNGDNFIGGIEYLHTTNEMKLLANDIFSIGINNAGDVSIENGDLIIVNQGAGADPFFGSNNAAQVLSLTGALNISSTLNVIANITGTASAIIHDDLNFGNAASAATDHVISALGSSGDGGISIEPKGAGVANLGTASGKASFFGGAGVTKPTVTGSRGSGAALTDLLTQLASLDLIIDSSTA